MYTYSRKIGFSMAINFVEEIWTCHKNEIRSCYQQNRSQLLLQSWANIIIIITAPTQRVINWPINVIFQMKIYCRHTHIHMYLSFTSIHVCHYCRRCRLHSRRCQFYCRFIRIAKFIATEWKSSISIEIGKQLINRTAATLECVLNKILSLAEMLIAHSVR